MSKLIEQFLETHRQCTAQNSVFNISQALDQEALAFMSRPRRKHKDVQRENRMRRLISKNCSTRL